MRVTETENHRSLRVLLVEDSLPLRERIRSMIEEAGTVEIVGEAGTVPGALVLFRKHQPDAVVLDLQLADGTGYSVLREIKQTHPGCTVIVLTTFTAREFRVRCLEMGADHFLDKSTEFERVLEVLADLHRVRSPREIL